jgi:hypothetical protein
MNPTKKILLILSIFYPKEDEKEAFLRYINSFAKAKILFNI